MIGSDKIKDCVRHRAALEGFGRQLLKTDEIVIKATGDCMAVERVLTLYVKRAVIANPFQEVVSEIRTSR